MQLRFLGPLSIVTGSCAWLRDPERGWNFLVDCGMQQGEYAAEAWNKRKWPFDPVELQFVVLTHGHIDHCGLLPRLYKDGFTGKVYCTSETAEVAKIILEDSASHEGALYRSDDVARINWHEHRAIPVLGGLMRVGDDLFIRYLRTGHIIGAVSVAVVWGPKGPDQRSIVFSGDLGPNVEDQEHLPYLRHRMSPVGCTYAVVESTYGATVRDPAESDPMVRRAELRGLLDQTIERQGVLVLPCFALGRTQDVLFDLHWLVAEDPERYGKITYHFDAPMAAKLQKVTAAGLERTESNGKNGKVRPLWLGKQMYRWFDLDPTDPVHTQRLLDILSIALRVPRPVKPAPSAIGNAVARAWKPTTRQVVDRKALKAKGLGQPAVIVTGGGMCDGGPVAFWLSELLGDPNVTVALTGYCSNSTVGGQLMALANATIGDRQRHTGRLKWSRDLSFPIRDIKASITRITGYSAHADQKGLVDWLISSFRDQWQAAGKTIFIQHGEQKQRVALAAAVSARAAEVGLEITTVLPESDDAWHDLETDGRAISREAERAKTLELIERLKKQLEWDDAA